MATSEFLKAYTKAVIKVELKVLDKYTYAELSTIVLKPRKILKDFFLGKIINVELLEQCASLCGIQLNLPVNE